MTMTMMTMEDSQHSTELLCNSKWQFIYILLIILDYSLHSVFVWQAQPAFQIIYSCLAQSPISIPLGFVDQMEQVLLSDCPCYPASILKMRYCTLSTNVISCTVHPLVSFVSLCMCTWVCFSVNCWVCLHGILSAKSLLFPMHWRFWPDADASVSSESDSQQQEVNVGWP